jgi:hypothetical protein
MVQELPLLDFAGDSERERKTSHMFVDDEVLLRSSLNSPHPHTSTDASSVKKGIESAARRKTLPLRRTIEYSRPIYDNHWPYAFCFIQVE